MKALVTAGCVAACLVPALQSQAQAQMAAQAASGVVVYGNFDEYIGYIDSSNGGHIVGLNDGAILRSRLGFRGTEDLGGGLQAKFALEQGINADTGSQADGTRLFDRQAWVGVNTSVGEFRIGRQNTQIFLIGGAIDYTSRTTFGSVLNTFGIPSRYDNDLSYKSPRMAGAQIDLHYALPENGAAGNATRGNHPVLQFSLDYERGPWRAGYSGFWVKPNDLTATVREKVVYHNVYADYNYGAGKLYAAAVRSNNSTANANGLNAGVILSNVSSPNNYFAGTDVNAARFYNIWQLSADYQVSAQLRVGALFGAIHDTSGNDGGARGANAGGYYDLSKRTQFYGFASMLKNQAKAGFRFSSSAGPSTNLAGADINGQRLAGLQLGVLHKF